jgi:hypothetical protein
MTFDGDFETHITVSLSASDEWERFRDWCSARRLKCVHIALDRGVHASQPMLTSYGTGPLEEALHEAKSICHALEAAEFSVVRVKTEVPPWNPDVPIADNAANFSNDRYFEHHIKVLLSVDADLVALGNLVQPHGAQLSRNARRVRDDGLQERFATQHCYHVGRDTAQQRFESLVQVLCNAEYDVIETEQEYVVFDSNVALDAGWLTAQMLGRKVP